MQKTKTLVILSPGFPENEADSTCMPPQQLFVKALKETDPGLNVIVLSFEYPFTKQQYDWRGIKVIAFGGKNRNKFRRLLNWFSIWSTLKKLNKQTELIGLLSFWFDECALLGHYFAKTHRLKYYAWILGQDAKAGNRYFKLIKPKARSLIALSDFVARQVLKNYGVLPQFTITTGVDTSLFGNDSPKRDIDILGAGSLIPLKQYDVFIEAIKFLTAFFPDINTVICGKGPEKDILAKLIKNNGLQNNIALRDELPHVEVLQLMQRSKIFLHTSAYEGFGAVLLEALYGGAQVVSFVKPMDADIPHHHPVTGLTDMCHKLLDILNEPHTDHQPVLVYPIQQVANDILKLYAYNDRAMVSNRPAIASNDRFDW